MQGGTLILGNFHFGQEYTDGSFSHYIYIPLYSGFSNDLPIGCLLYNSPQKCHFCHYSLSMVYYPIKATWKFPVDTLGPRPWDIQWDSRWCNYFHNIDSTSWYISLEVDMPMIFPCWYIHKCMCIHICIYIYITCRCIHSCICN